MSINLPANIIKKLIKNNPKIVVIKDVVPIGWDATLEKITIPASSNALSCDMVFFDSILANKKVNVNIKHVFITNAIICDILSS